MKLGMIALALAGSSAALSTDAPPAPTLDQASYEEPARRWTDVEDATSRQRCRDRIERVRAASGKPELEVKPAGEEEPLLHYAVDKRVDGCGVLVPVGDPTDLRSPPAPGKPALRPVEPRE